MIIHPAWQLSFEGFSSKPIVVELRAAQLTSDAGLLPIRQFDEKIGLTEQFARVLDDPRDSLLVGHSLVEMVRMRVYGILADYPDQNDHDLLRGDSVFKLLAGRSPQDSPLASQPTLSRFENGINIPSLWRLREVLVDQFLASFATPPRHLTFDIDAFDDAAHGQQQLVFFHGYYDQYQYLPRVITCAQNDLVVMACLLHGTAHPTLGLEDDLEYLTQRIRAVWPDVRIEIRGDCGLGMPGIYAACERLRLDYTIGLGMNAVLKRHSAELLAQAEGQYAQTGQPQRLFTAFWYQAESWPEPRWVVVKAEAHAQGTNRRAVVTNRPGATILPGPTYDEYVERGESENRNKELKCGLHADRLSDHRFLANYFRLYLHCAAANLLARLRPVVALPSPPVAENELPVQALAGKARHDYFNRRRERDPLGEGHPGTWRTRLIKVAAEIVVTSRRIWVRLSGTWPYLGHYRHVAQRVLAYLAGPLPKTG